MSDDMPRDRTHPSLPVSQVRAMIEYRQREGRPYLNVKLPVAAALHAWADKVFVPVTPEAALQVLEYAADQQLMDVTEECWLAEGAVREGWTLKIVPTKRGRK